MNIKKLETKLQTILEDDLFEINQKNINEKIGNKLMKIIEKKAICNDAISQIESINDEYASIFSDANYSNLFVSGTNALTNLLDRECYHDRNIFLDVINEIFTNQELYDSIKIDIPEVIEIVDKLNSKDCIFSLEELKDWFCVDLDEISMNDIENVSIYDYLNDAFKFFNNLFVADENNNYVKNKKEDERNEGTGSN